MSWLSLLPRAMCLVMVPLLVSCPQTQRIAVALQPCVVRGMPWVAVTNPPSNQPGPQGKWDTLLDDANAIWAPQADIAFFTTANAEIIDDPMPPSNGASVGAPTGPGKLGDIEQQDDYPSAETDAVVASCRAAWARAGASSLGVTVVLVREIVRRDGGFSQKAAFEAPIFSTYFRNGGKDVCDRPLQLVAADVADRWIVLETTSNTPTPSNPLTQVLAHELGHSLLLQHGDGQDNDHNGRWDDVCDHPEFASIDENGLYEELSLMDPSANRTTITALQRELARSAAVLVKGSLGGPP